MFIIYSRTKMKNLVKSLSKVILLILFFIPSLAFPQDRLIDVITPQKVQWKNGEESRFAKLSSNRDFEKVEVVSFNDIFSLQKDGVVTLDSALFGEQIQATTFRMEYKSNIEYNWLGVTADGLGSIYISRNGNRYRGYVSIPGKANYQIVRLGEDSDKHVLIKQNPSVLDSRVCGSKEGSKITVPMKEEGGRNGRIEACNTQIQVLVLYTPEAVSTTGVNINDLAANCISQFNNTIYRSNVPYQAVVELAGVVQFGVTLSQSMETDVGDLITNPNANSLRTQYKADLVIIITQDHPDPSLAGYAGTLTLEDAKSYAMVEVQKAQSDKAFAHELGHLFGCRHRHLYDNNPPQYAHAYRFRIGLPAVGPFCKTLMTSSPDPDKLENFSNPNVSVSNKPTGTAANEDNARRVSETWPTVKAFEPEPNVLWGYVDGPGAGVVYSYYTWEAVTACGNAPFSYEWRTSTDGFSWSGVKGTGEFFTDYLPWNNSSYHHIWLRVTSADNQQTDAYITVYKDYTPVGGRLSAEEGVSTVMVAPISWKATEVNIEPLANYEVPLLVYPNPSQTKTKVEFSIDSESLVTIDIIDLSGKRVRTLAQGKRKSGFHSPVFSLDNLAAGNYILRLTTPSKVETTKILIAK